MKKKKTALQRLSEAAGIHPHYWDIFGTGHETSPATQRALLSAMGFDVSTPVAIRECLAATEQARLRRILSPTTVLRRDRQALSVSLSLPASAQTLRWRVACESGETRSGSASFEELAETDRLGKGRGSRSIRSLSLPDDLPDGYHRLSITVGREQDSGCVIIAPAAAYVPDWMAAGERRWGLATHLYAARSRDDWGIGDLSSLAGLMDAADDRGAAVVGINPLHAMFSRHPGGASPYSPSSRHFLNPLYIDVAAVSFLADCPRARGLMNESGFTQSLEAVNAGRHIDYTAVSTLKHQALDTLYGDFQALPAERRRAFEEFRRSGGEPLRRFCLFETLHEHFDGWAWPDWPAEYRTPQNAAVDAFADEHAGRVGYHAFLQWLAETQLAAAIAGRKARLYRDLAAGADRCGADSWADPEATVRDITFGAPPDAFNEQGQNWGVPPPHPHAMATAGYAPFTRLFEANMRHAGALRIDHVLGLMRLFWIPDGAKATEGAYVTYPFEDLAGVLALESHRNRCLVVGEDLGTVPDAFRDYMERERFLFYRVFYFERWPNGLFKRPDAYPELALATATTHDLATLAGYWSGGDLDLRDRLDLLGEDDLEDAEAVRLTDRELLIAALADQELVEDDFVPEGSTDADVLKRLAVAVQRYLARSRAQLMMANLDDLMMEPEQLNLPGTIDQYPNWRRRLSVRIEDMAGDPDIAAALQAIDEERRA